MSDLWAPGAEKMSTMGVDRQRRREGIKHINRDIGRTGQAVLERHGQAVLAPAGFLP